MAGKSNASSRWRLGFEVGSLVGLAAGIAAERFYLATLVFRLTKVMSGHPAVFLDWTRRSGLLRVTGTAYQFRHETYQQWIRQSPSSESGSFPSTSGECSSG